MMRAGHSIVYLMMFYFFVFPVIGHDADHDYLPEVQAFIESGNWEKAEARLLFALWTNPSGTYGIEAAKLLARMNIITHKAPQAMEWLEMALNNPDICPRESTQIENKLKTLQRLYLPGYQHRLDTSVRIEGADFESPRHLVITEAGNLAVMDRYKLIVLSSADNTIYQVQPPTSPIPDRARSLKLTNGNPVIVTDSGYWLNHRSYRFQAPTELSRIVDAVYTTNNKWYVMDRRNTNLLVFDDQGEFVETRSITAPTGNEKLLKHPLGGSWSLMPASRLITILFSPMTVSIPFRGPGYQLVDPVDFSTDWFGHLYVLNRNGTVTVFSPGGVWLKTINPDPRGNILRTPSAIAVCANGSIFIADRKRHNVYCFR